jgi:ADP-heptose:LPS heptosyltransferase
VSAERILIIRTSALGDVVHCLPVLTALRRERPEARIGWVVESAMAPLLEGHPDLDELLVVSLRRWRRAPWARSTWRELRGFLAAIDRFSPSVVLDLMGNHKAGLIAALSGADRRVGLAHGERREPSSAIWISEPVAALGPHAVDRALSTLAALAIEPGPPDFGGGRLFRQHGSGGADGAREPFVLICPGAAWANKRYPPERWGRAAALLADGGGGRGRERRPRPRPAGHQPGRAGGADA